MCQNVINCWGCSGIPCTISATLLQVWVVFFLFFFFSKLKSKFLKIVFLREVYFQSSLYVCTDPRLCPQPTFSLNCFFPLKNMANRNEKSHLLIKWNCLPGARFFPGASLFYFGSIVRNLGCLGFPPPLRGIFCEVSFAQIGASLTCFLSCATDCPSER